MPRLFTLACIVSIAPFALVTQLVRPAVAHADPARDFTLAWSAPAGCPTRAEMEERIARLVGVGKRAREPLTARATLTAQSAGAMRADVELSASGQASSRHVEGDSCAAVSDAIVLIVALAIDPETVIPPAPAPTPTPPPPPPPPPEKPRRLVFVAAAPRLDVGSVPAPVLGGELALGVQPTNLDLEVDGALLASARASLGAHPTEGADIRLSELGGRGCYELEGPTFALGPCAGLQARWLSASGFGATTTKHGTALFGALSLGGLATARLSSRFSLRFAADAVLPLSRPSFVIDTSGTVYQAPKVALRTIFGAELHF